MHDESDLAVRGSLFVIHQQPPVSAEQPFLVVLTRAHGNGQRTVRILGRRRSGPSHPARAAVRGEKTVVVTPVGLKAGGETPHGEVQAAFGENRLLKNYIGKFGVAGKLHQQFHAIGGGFVQFALIGFNPGPQDHRIGQRVRRSHSLGKSELPGHGTRP